MGRKKKVNKATPELDLHGVKHADVEVMVEDFALAQKDSVKIITGNSKKMKDLVKKALTKHGYQFLDFFPGFIIAS